jgi:hypothetical protein
LGRSLRLARQMRTGVGHRDQLRADHRVPARVLRSAVRRRRLLVRLSVLRQARPTPRPHPVRRHQAAHQRRPLAPEPSPQIRMPRPRSDFRHVRFRKRQRSFRSRRATGRRLKFLLPVQAGSLDRDMRRRFRRLSASTITFSRRRPTVRTFPNSALKCSSRRRFRRK